MKTTLTKTLVLILVIALSFKIKEYIQTAMQWQYITLIPIVIYAMMSSRKRPNNRAKYFTNLFYVTIIMVAFNLLSDFGENLEQVPYVIIPILVGGVVAFIYGFVIPRDTKIVE